MEYIPGACEKKSVKKAFYDKIKIIGGFFQWEKDESP
jgi:hypothetical protein